jgi:hypothetical protein
VGNSTPIRSIVRDNIMLSAYVAEQINLYEAATGSDRFDQPGALTFVWKDGRTFAYDHHSIAEAVRRNFEANPLGFSRASQDGSSPPATPRARRP